MPMSKEWMLKRLGLLVDIASFFMEKFYPVSKIEHAQRGWLQRRFAWMQALLILKAISLGYTVTMGDGNVDAFNRLVQNKIVPQRASKLLGHSTQSLHWIRLAVDLCLFKDGKYLTDSEDYRTLGKWWKGLGGSWGGDFKNSKGEPRPDGNHFSLACDGYK